jgi:hypothetical protein
MGFTHLQIEQNPWLGGYRPQIFVPSALCPQLNLLNPPPKKIPGENSPPPPPTNKGGEARGGGGGRRLREPGVVGVTG